MHIDIYQVDAFAEHVFQGNPAAVCPLNAWIADELLQKIAQANNLSETCLLVFNSLGSCLALCMSNHLVLFASVWASTLGEFKTLDL
ncbi:MAG: hypothetical protein ACJAV1_002091 [Paraglaciecola sp.]|jgi:hypothetical protein